ncbi:DUF3043 domain-containing protein [Nocardioides sp. GY 10113]|uniref:DUF3043 domain-containing protein n=1 Tax=Nocardioides sp. GY 10113 TaxID=2569761 RepID=UPI0010A7A9F7|nr:DUF3043 domain-containing protein [Nocardioides sp. GY 10113]TIC88711.1 DUF3043 domain-containing protein [Nocardioides sp. GY 10113]
MFKRTKSEPVATAPTATKEGGKGRPTPTRKEAEAAAKARARAPRDRKELAKRDRAARAERSAKVREAMKTGDERYFLQRDKGPVRRFIRDFVDVRFSVIELMIPLLILSMVLGYTGNPALMSASSLILMVTLAAIVIELFLLRFKLRRQLARRFPDEPLKGTTYYALTRAMQMKFMRMPKARVKIGQDLPEDYR